MTTLEAVNEVLESVGEQPSLELDTGGTSDVAEAETHLDRARKKILRRGWACNREIQLLVTLPTVRLQVTVSTGTFTLDQIVTHSGGATGMFAYEEGGYVYLRPVSGTFTGSGTISASGGVLRTVVAYTDVVQAKIPVSSDWLSIMPAAKEPIAFVTRDGFLYDPILSTFELSADVTALIAVMLDFDSLTHALARYVIAEASATFQRYKRRGQFDEALLQQAIQEARIDAEQEDTDLLQTNVLTTQQSRDVRGGRGRSLYEGDPNYA
jgi:hypothetical protein